MKIKLKSVPRDIMPMAGAKKSNPVGMIVSDTTTDDNQINSSVKPVDEDKANIEAEKGEILLKFDMGGMFNIKGKKHYQGGTPLIADEGDFIFSDDKDLAITTKEKEMFGFKKGKSSKSNSTPAKVLAKEAPPKEYNKFLSILKDNKADSIAKRTAILMMEKYQNRL